jgi:hypothetical protein
MKGMAPLPNMLPKPTPQTAPINNEEEPLFKDEPSIAPQAVGGSKRTRGYTKLEHVCRCKAWMEIGHDPICGAPKKGGIFWRKIYNYFHEHKN